MKSNKKVDKEKSAKRLLVIALILIILGTASLVIATRGLKYFNTILPLLPVFIIGGICCVVAFVFHVAGVEKFSKCVVDARRDTEKTYRDRLRKQKAELVAEAEESAKLRLEIATLFGFKEILANNEGAWELMEILLTQGCTELSKKKKDLTSTLEKQKSIILKRVCEEKKLNEEQRNEVVEFLKQFSTRPELEALEDYIFSPITLGELRNRLFGKVQEVTPMKQPVPEQEEADETVDFEEHNEG